MALPLAVDILIRFGGRIRAVSETDSDAEEDSLLGLIPKRCKSDGGRKHNRKSCFRVLAYAARIRRYGTELKTAARQDSTSNYENWPGHGSCAIPADPALAS